MKRTKQIKIKPRNPVAVAPILKKGGPHKRKDKRAERARIGTEIRKRLRDD